VESDGKRRGGHYDWLGFLAARIYLGGEITGLKLMVGFVLGHDEVIIHIPGYPRVAVLFDIKERDLNASFSGSLGWQTRHSRGLLLVGAASPKRPVIIHPELPSL
jgi:hypothetical protein